MASLLCSCSRPWWPDAWCFRCLRLLSLLTPVASLAVNFQRSFSCFPSLCLRCYLFSSVVQQAGTLMARPIGVQVWMRRSEAPYK